MPKAYYNENDPACATWLHNLICKGLIAPGDVDSRSIKDIKPDELKGYTQCAPINANNSPEARIMRLRGYGNAIVPQLAAEFIKAYMDCMP